MCRSFRWRGGDEESHGEYLVGLSSTYAVPVGGSRKSPDVRIPRLAPLARDDLPCRSFDSLRSLGMTLSGIPSSVEGSAPSLPGG